MSLNCRRFVVLFNNISKLMDGLNWIMNGLIRILKSTKTSKAWNDSEEWEFTSLEMTLISNHDHWSPYSHAVTLPRRAQTWLCWPFIRFHLLLCHKFIDKKQSKWNIRPKDSLIEFVLWKGSQYYRRSDWLAIEKRHPKPIIYS